MCSSDLQLHVHQRVGERRRPGEHHDDRVGVFADAIIVVFAGATAFPDALVHVQLTPELEVEDIEIVGDDDEDDEDDDED